MCRRMGRLMGKGRREEANVLWDRHLPLPLLLSSKTASVVTPADCFPCDQTCRFIITSRETFGFALIGQEICCSNVKSSHFGATKEYLLSVLKHPSIWRILPMLS
ncbi:hypothetical protein I7I50_01381 [Histoplasma capsulatum G186AR]|uniref:Uncharacterized protein n=1 Tax=Ajellomyces capsulatus TaxID=5037 RepID=A0A8H8CSC0_AJECA|nr:hypothetical protein I7I52_12497 [Histoplasma capsulatum]QSS73274.1 hypothetical protein I7I50_01381 [Histoplasma capsulatum G186AR]